MAPFWSPVLHEYPKNYTKLSNSPPSEFGEKIWAEKRAESERRPFFWSLPKSGQKNGLNPSEDLFLKFPAPLSKILRTPLSASERWMIFGLFLVFT